MARAKPETAEKATKAKTAKVKPEAASENGEKKGRRPGGDRGWLAREIEAILRNTDGQVTVRDLRDQITNARGEHPSSGAVAAALVRWSDQGYVELTGSRPQAFKRFVGKYKNKSLDDFLNDQKSMRKKERDAAKAEKAA